MTLRHLREAKIYEMLAHSGAACRGFGKNTSWSRQLINSCSQYFIYLFIYLMFHKEQLHLLPAQKKNTHDQQRLARDEAAGWKADNPNTNEKQIPPESHLKGNRPKVRITHSSPLISSSPLTSPPIVSGSQLHDVVPVGSDEARRLIPHFNLKLQ